MKYLFTQPVLHSGGNGLQRKHPDMRNLFSAFKYALAGFGYTFRNERNFRIEILFALGACTAGFIFHITPPEWCIVVMNIGAVLSAELFNTAIEKICNEFSREIRPGIKVIKDVSAAAVLVFAIISLVCGLIIFVPHFLGFKNV